MASTSPGSSADAGVGAPCAAADGAAAWPAIYFDGVTSRKHAVALIFGTHLEISEDGVVVASWGYDELRAVDGGPGGLRLKCVSALPLARLDVSDPAAQAEIRARARFLDIEHGSRQTGRIVAWSLAAIVSIAATVFIGVPLVAERLVPLIPLSFERRLGEMADNQVRLIFGGKVCTDPQGNAAFAKLVETLRQAGHVDIPLRTAVLASPIPNAFALPGGKIYLLDGLLQKANNADEIAGVIAHEMGHVSHRDLTRMMIQNGSTSFLIGLLFGDITGSGAAIFVTRSVVGASYSREAEKNADAFAIDTMHALDRSPAPMGELLYRVTGAQGDSTIGILASHPLTEERRALMRQEDRPATGPEILSAAEWRALKGVCGPQRPSSAGSSAK
jgi:Zn-dependent protease with chaperone function